MVSVSALEPFSIQLVSIPTELNTTDCDLKENEIYKVLAIKSIEDDSSQFLIASEGGKFYWVLLHHCRLIKGDQYE